MRHVITGKTFFLHQNGDCLVKYHKGFVLPVTIEKMCILRLFMYEFGGCPQIAKRALVKVFMEWNIAILAGISCFATSANCMKKENYFVIISEIYKNYA